MYLSLKGSLGHTPITDRVGENLLQIAEGASAAYSLRNLGSDSPAVVRVRRESDNNERDFTAQDISTSVLTNWVNEQITPPLDLRELTATGRDGPIIEAAAAYSLRNLSDSYTGDVVEVRRTSDNAVRSFTAAEVTDGTLVTWVLGDAASLVGDAQWFNGVDAYVNLGTGDPLGFNGSGRIDFGCNVVIGAIPTSTEDIFYQYVSANGVGFAVGIQSSGQVRVSGRSIFADGFQSLLSTTLVTVGETRIDAYIDYANNEIGISLNAGAYKTGSAVFGQTSFTYGSSTNNTRIGNSQASARFFTGSVFNVEIQRDSVASNSFTGLGNDPWVDTIGTNDGTPSNLVTFTGQGFDGFVSKWYDQSTTSGVPNAKHAVQTSAGRQPKIVDGGSLVTGGNKFDGANDFLTFPATFLSGSFAISTVFNLQDRYKPNNTLFGYSNSGNFIRYQGSNRIGIKINSVENFIDRGLANDTDYVMSITRDASNLVSLYVDGSLIGSFTQSGLFSLDRIGVFAESSSYFLKGTVTETLIYKTDQTDNRTALEANIGEVYGIAGIPAYEDTVNGFVETWYDQSGNGNDATQLTAGNQPKIVDSGALVAGGLDFDGVADVLETSLVPPNVATLIGVANWDVINATGIIIGARDSVNQRSYIAQVSSGNTALGLVSSPLFGPDVVAGDDYLLFGTYSGLTRLLSTNGSVVSDSNGSSPNNTIHGYSIGALNTAGTNGSFMTGTIGEVIVYPSDQSANRPAIEANINNQYDIY